jgi:hypothetical protein
MHVCSITPLLKHKAISAASALQRSQILRTMLSQYIDVATPQFEV